jgi:hypothetical protein
VRYDCARLSRAGHPFSQIPWRQIQTQLAGRLHLSCANPTRRGEALEYT